MEKMKPTLLVLAAGMGSRYGGLKQLDQVGPNGETIIDYSIYYYLYSCQYCFYGYMVIWLYGYMVIWLYGFYIIMML